MATPSQCPPVRLGLIGRDEGQSFRDILLIAHQFADLVVVRPSLADWLKRPIEPELSHVLLVDQSRYAGDPDWSRLNPDVQASLAPRARWLRFRGPLAAPEPRTIAAWDRSERISKPQSISFREFDLFFQPWLAETTCQRVPFADPSAVVVLSQTFATAEPIIDLLTWPEDEPSRTAVWRTAPAPLVVRGVVAYVWDESVAPPCDVSEWRERIGRCAATVGGTRAASHVWLTAMGTPRDRDAARRAGVACTLDKPFRRQSLINAIARATFSLSH